MRKKVVSGRYKKGKFGIRINKYGIKFTSKEYKKYIELNKIVERKRKKLERQGRKIYGSDYKNYFGKQIVSLHFYETKAEFRDQMQRLERYASTNYKQSRDEQLFENYKQKIAEVFKDQDAYEVIMNTIEEMSTEQFIDAYQEGDIEDIAYLYPVKSKYLGTYDEQKIIEQAQRIVNRVG